MRAKGWMVEVTDDTPTAVELTLTGRYRVAVLDMDRQDGDALQILGQILKARPEQKVIALSAAGKKESGVSALENGATDFLTRPFSVEELLARVLSRLQEPTAGHSGWQLHTPNLTLDLARRTVRNRRGEVRLPQREFVFLTHLMSEQGRVFTREELLAEVWSDTPDAASNVVDVCVRRLRARLGDDVIETVRHVGYTLRSA